MTWKFSFSKVNHQSTQNQECFQTLSVQSDSKRRAFNASDEFAQFQETDSLLWNPSRRQDELVPPSEDFNWSIAHHLHNPSFITQNPHNEETADPTNPCIGLVMANAFVKGKTLIYDHLARREVVDGLVNYSEHILRCHEAWLLKIRRNMLTKVEILYGRSIQKRMLSICDLERLPLWDRHSGIAVYLEWMSDDPESPARLARLLVFAMHPQNFLFPWGKKFAKEQDHRICIAHHLAGLTYNNQFYQNLHWSFVNRFPKLNHYIQQQALARDVFKAIQAAKGSGIVSIKMPLEKEILYRPSIWNSNRAMKRILLDSDNNSFLDACPQNLNPQSSGTSEHNTLDNPTERELVISSRILRYILILQTLQQLVRKKGSSLENHIPPRCLKTTKVNSKLIPLFARILGLITVQESKVQVKPE